MLAAQSWSVVNLGRVVDAKLFALAVLALTALSVPSGAFAQCVNNNFSFSGSVSVNGITRSLVPTASPLVSITNTVNTAFLTNMTSFVSAPSGPQSDQASGGVWARGIGGFVDSQAKS